MKLNWRQMEKEWLIFLLTETKFNVALAARVGGRSERRMGQKIREHRLLEWVVQGRTDIKLNKIRDTTSSEPLVTVVNQRGRGETG